MSQRNRPDVHHPIQVIAITGCDGSGKSTLATSLTHHLSSERMTKLLYLGQSSGRIAEWISTLPFIGASFAQYLQEKSARVHQHPSSPPGHITAMVIYLLSCWRAVKFWRMLVKCKKGYLIITDRYPQNEVAGFRFDGPQLARTQGGNLWLRTLRKSERKIYQWMASFTPSLLIRLDIDADTAHSRKPDHALSVLREKTAVIPHLTFNGATILDLNGREPADKILNQSLCVIDSILHTKSHAN